MVELPENRDSRRMLVLDSHQAGELASSETRVLSTLLCRLHTCILCKWVMSEGKRGLQQCNMN